MREVLKRISGVFSLIEVYGIHSAREVI